MRPRKKTQQQPTDAMVLDRPFKRPRSMPFAAQIGAVASSTAPEKKNLDTSSTLTGAAASQFAPLNFLNGIARGASPNERIGRRIVLKSLLVRWQAPTSQAPFRLLVVYDHAPNAALALITDVLTADAINNPMNLVNNDRFMVLHDELVNQNSSGQQCVGKFYIKLGPKGVGLQCQWNGNATGTIADITTGAILFTACSASGGTVSIPFISRVRYTDL